MSFITQGIQVLARGILKPVEELMFILLRNIFGMAPPNFITAKEKPTRKVCKSLHSMLNSGIGVTSKSLGG